MKMDVFKIFILVFMFNKCSSSEIVTGQSEIRNLPCRMDVRNYSAEYFANLVKQRNANFANLVMYFDRRNASTLPTNGGAHEDFASDVVLPGQWIWTFRSSFHSFNFLHWPMDFKIISLGLLTSNALPDKVTVYIKVDPPGCKLELGNQTTTGNICNAMLELTTNYLVKLPTLDNDDYTFSYWCYFAKRNKKDYNMQTFLGRLIPYPVMGLGYKCCEQSMNYTDRKTYTNYDAPIRTVWVYVIMMPYVLAIILLGQFPVLLTKLGSLMVKNGTPLNACHINNPKFSYTRIKSDTESDTEDEIIDTEAEHAKELSRNWLFLDDSSPIFATKYILIFLSFANMNPLIASRIRRLLFIILLPIAIYIEIYVYYVNMFSFILGLVDSDIPCGFLSMLAGFEKSRNVFLPYLGGPFVAFGMFYLFGFMVLMWPNDLGAVLVKGLPPHHWSFRCLLSMDLTLLERRTFIKCVRFSGYEKVFRCLHARFLFFIKPNNWKFVVRFQVRRFQKWFQSVVNEEQRFCVRCLASLGLPFYMLVCILEIILTLLYFVVPMFGFLHISVMGYFSEIRAKKNAHPIACVAGIIFSLIIIVFVYLFCIILLASFMFLGKILSFVYISIIVFPSYCFGYVFFVCAMVYYLHRLTNTFRLPYREILRITVEKSLQLQSSISIPSENDRRSNIERMNDCETCRIGELHGHSYLENVAKSCKFVRYIGYRPGIPKKLFEKIVRRIRPVYINLFWLLLQIFTIGGVVGGSISFLSHFNHYARFDSGLMHVLSIGAISSVPRLLQFALIKPNGYIPDETTRCIEHVVKCYWSRRVNRVNDAI